MFSSGTKNSPVTKKEVVLLLKTASLVRYFFSGHFLSVVSFCRQSVKYLWSKTLKSEIFTLNHSFLIAIVHEIIYVGITCHGCFVSIKSHLVNGNVV